MAAPQQTPEILAQADPQGKTPAQQEEQVRHGRPSDASLNAPNPYNASMEETLLKLRREQGNTPGFEDVERRFHEIAKSLEQQAAEMGVTSLKVHVNSDRGNEVKNHIVQSKEDHYHLFLDEGRLREALRSDAATEEYKGATIGHELAHAYKGDVTPKGIVASQNDDVSRRTETRADIIGSSALGAHNPEATAAYYENELRIQTFAYNITHPEHKVPANASEADRKKVSDWAAEIDPQHPGLLERINTMKQEAGLMAEYEKTHKIVTHDDKVKEADTLVKEIMGDSGQIHGQAPAAPGSRGEVRHAANTLNGEQLAQVDEIKQLWNSVQRQPLDMGTAPGASKRETGTGQQRA